jgi:large subunit ribosomal protein L22
MATAENERTEVRAEARYVRAAPRKAQLVADQIRGRSVPEARTILAFMTRDAARDVEKVLNSAVANAEQNHGLDGDELVVSAAFVGAGPTLKRWRARARGRVARIRKRTCHITVRLAQPDGGVIPVVEAMPVAPPPEEAKPKRASRKPAESAETAETAAAPEQVEEAEEAPKPKRATKPKADSAEEKPKPKRAAKPEAKAGEKTDEKPKRKITRKKSEES